jgi:hypothetical protein
LKYARKGILLKKKSLKKGIGLFFIYLKTGWVYGKMRYVVGRGAIEAADIYELKSIKILP